MAIDLSALSSREALSAVYIGYYDRAADVAGMQFWEQVVANTSLDLVAITSDFASQSETQEVHPFFADPATSSPATFITSLYQNLFNRDPDTAGLEFWSGALQDAIDGVPGAISVGEIITAIIEGAVDVEGGTQDRTVILNKIEVAVSWTDAAEAAGDEFGALSMASAKSIIEGVTDDPATVVAAKATVDDFFADDTGGGNGGTPGEKMFLTSATDVMTGTENDDEFLAYIQQNPFAGGVSNSLSSADRLDGGAGDDRLYAEVSHEFLGTNSAGALDIQPRLSNIEEIDIEARDTGVPGGDAFGEDNYFYGGEEDAIVVDGKNITDHVEIGSYFSDGDLTIENLTTLTSNGTARNTSEITVTMDHTDNFNTDKDASDLKVLFDNDYLLSGQEAEGKVFYFLLDEDAELAGLDDRLNNIDVDGLRFNITNADGTVTAVNLEAIEANLAGTHQGFVNALQPRLQELIADGTLPAGTTLTLDPTVTDVTFLDDGSQSDDIPAIVLTSGDGSEVVATGFSRIQEEIGEYDVYGRFDSFNEVEDQPISINIDLHKVGRGGEGGNLIIGGKDTDVADGIAAGIEVFNINVLGAGNDDPNGGMTKPSNLGTIQSTAGALDIVNIATDPAYATGDTFASLEVRNGFDGNTSLINADAFLGDLMLYGVDNADTITAQGGGDVTLGLDYNGSETDTAYSVTTGGGDDDIDVYIDGDALDYANSSFNVSTGAGDDSVEVYMDINEDGDNDEELNQAILDNILIETGDGDDFVDLNGNGVANIETGAGDDTIFTDGWADEGGNAVWAFNFDALRVNDEGDLNNFDPDDLPGEQVSLAYLGGATVTVTLSGAGIFGDVGAGGGVMALDSDDPLGASPFEDGYEASAQISSLINGNDFYGDQRDVNAAIMEAINDDPILSQLLTVTMGSNNTLVIASTTSGDFQDSDLRIEIERPDRDSWTAVQSEARSLFSNSELTVTSVSDADDAAGVDLESSDGADAWFDGLSANGDEDNSTTGGVGELESNLHTRGDNSDDEVDTVINGGAGDDLIVLSTKSQGDDPDDFTVSSNNALLNGASNETIVMTGDDFGDDTIMNFETAGDYSTTTTSTTVTGTITSTTVTGSGTTATTITTTTSTTNTVTGTLYSGIDGIDFLDFSAYLTSLTSSSGSSVSERKVAVTLDYGTDAVAGEMDANEVVVVRYANDPDEPDTFASLSAADVAALYNNGDGSGDYDDDALVDTDFNVSDGASATDVVNGVGKGILMVENAGNLGEYKVFEITWDASEADGDEGVTAVELGSLDFGDSLEGLDEINLVGSESYNDLLANGFGGGIA